MTGLEEVKTFIKNTSLNTKVYVGCDSRNTKEKTLYVTAIVVHLDGNRGAKVFAFQESVPRIRSMKQRLDQEVYYALEKAIEIRDTVGDRELQIHLDYHPSEKYKSNRSVSNSVGAVVGSNFKYALKPNAHAASSAADYLGRNNVQFKSPSF
jgi:predicted RNase H-related nuclease YkuK (DUF458 family)